MNTYSTYMRPDPCVRQHLVDQGLALYRKTVETGHGRIVFFVGEASMGGRATLHALADALPQQSPKPFLIGGQFMQGRYTPWSAVQNGAIIDLVGNVVSLLGIGLTGSPLLASIAGFLGQLLQTSAAAHAVTQDFYQKQQRTAADVLDPLVLYRPLRRAALDRPVVCMLEQFDQAEGSWWNSFLLEKALEITQLPILFLVSAEGPVQLPGTLAGEEPDMVGIAQRLCVKRNLADWQPLPPLTYAEVEEWVGRAEPILPRRLYEVCGGNPTWLRELWLDWFERGLLYASTEDLVWRCVAQVDPRTLGTVQDVLVRRLRNLLPDLADLARDDVSELLAVAALEGRTFTVAALAQAVQRDADEVIDLFDDYLLWQEDHPDGLLAEADPILIQRPDGEQTLWRYRFVAELHWLTLLHYRLTTAEQQTWSAKLAGELAQCYAPEERQVARPLARLYANAGNPERSHHFQRMADIATDREFLRAQAQQIMSTQWAGWEELDYARAARLLYEAGQAMLHYYLYTETAQVYAAAYTAATQAQLLLLQGATLNGLGLAHHSMGNVKEALAYYNQALPLTQQVGNKGGEATTLNNLGGAYSSLGDKAQALDYFNQALPLRRQVGDKGGEATTLNNIGFVYDALGEKAQALAYYNQALPLRRQVGDKGGEATTLSNLGAVYRSLGEKEQALAYYNQALPLHRQVGDKGGEATTLNHIGHVYSELDEKQQALDYYHQALPLLRQVGDKDGEATTLHHIGAVDRSLGDMEQALAYYNQALKLLRQIGDKAHEATTLTELGAVYSDLGNKVQALDYYNQALPLYRQVGDKGGEANILHTLGHVYHDLGEYDKALDYYNQGLSLVQKIDDKRTQAKHRYCIALTHITMSDLITAEEQLQAAVALAAAVQHPDLALYQAKLAEVQALRRQKAEGQA